MADRYLYLLLNVGTIAIPLMASFYAKANFSKTWGPLFKATTVVAAVFIVWDVLFTRMGVWGFNPTYLLGIDVLYLPIEEWMFFFTIPYACTFTYFSITHLVPKSPFEGLTKPITYGIIAAALLALILFPDRWYTATTMVLLILLLIVLLQTRYTRFLGHFYLSYLLVLFPFFLVNGTLTGSGILDEVVWYNNQENMGIRVGTIPLDDFFYCMLLLLGNVVLYEYFRDRKVLSTSH